MTRSLPTVDESSGVRFGRTLIVPAAGDLFSHEVQAIVCPANRRGVMGAGIAGRIRLVGGLDIEREAKLGGPVHSKGVLILTGYLAGLFGRERPLALSASIAFEQHYEEIEGDSAASAELTSGALTARSAMLSVPVTA